MSLHLHRARFAEHLADALARQLDAGYAAAVVAGVADPFDAVEIVVGSRGMERWLRHWLASGPARIAAQLTFPFPRAALNDAVDAALGRPARQGGGFDPQAFTPRIISHLRSLADDGDFAAVSAFIAEDAASSDPLRPVAARELSFAGEVADVLDRLLHDRPHDALAWIAAPDQAPAAHRWLARLLALWVSEQSDVASPAALHDALICGAGQAPSARGEPSSAKALHFFGLSALGLAEMERLAAVARDRTLHFYLLTPSGAWWEDIRTPSEARWALRGASGAGAVALTAALAEQNPLLASLGRPSRDMQSWLEALAYEEHRCGDGDDGGVAGSDDETGAQTTLVAVQRWIDAAGERDMLGPLRLDDSLELHAAHGALRQVEALRDRLLGLLEADPTLSPREILVMTPDIGTYAPLCAAIFARSGRGEGGRVLPSLPAHIADLGLKSTNGLAALLLAVLALCEERLTAAAICDLAALEPVRLRFGIDTDDLAQMTLLAQESGMRWGFDADDRAAAGQPQTFEHTLRFGLERLALGALWSDDDDPLDVVMLDDAPLEGAGPSGARRPLPLGSASARRAFAQLAALTLQIERLRVELRDARAPAVWRADLIEAVDALGATSADAAWLRAELREKLQTLLPETLTPLPFSRQAVAKLLSGAFDQPARGDRPITGAITVCALEPMRSVPYRVIALLGMDDGVFPRAGMLPTWSPFAEPRPGERDRREVDRHLLLEALLSTRDHLLVLWSGHDLETGEKRPAAVPIEELIDVLVARSEPEQRRRGAWVRDWPMQPWSPARFEPGAPPCFDADFAQAAGDLAAQRQGARAAAPLGLAVRAWTTGAVQALAAPPMAAAQLDTGALGRALADPSKTLLYGRLGLARAAGHVALDEREPFDLGTLAEWGLKDRVITAWIAAVMVDDVKDEAGLIAVIERSERAAGGLPHGPSGAIVVADAAVAAKAVVARLPLQALRGCRQPPPAFEVTLDDVTLTARAPLGVDGELIWTTASKGVKPSLCLEACYAALVARVALGDDVEVVARCIASDAKDANAIVVFVAPSAAVAAEWLRDALALWRQAQRSPLPLFAKTSRALAEVLFDPGGGALTDARLRSLRGGLEKAVHDRFFAKERPGGKSIPGEADDAATSLLWAGWSPLEALGDSREDGPLALALRLWTPIMRMSLLNNGLGDSVSNDEPAALEAT